MKANRSESENKFQNRIDYRIYHFNAETGRDGSTETRTYWKKREDRRPRMSTGGEEPYFEQFTKNFETGKRKTQGSVYKTWFSMICC